MDWALSLLFLITLRSVYNLSLSLCIYTARFGSALLECPVMMMSFIAYRTYSFVAVNLSTLKKGQPNTLRHSNSDYEGGGTATLMQELGNLRLYYVW